MCILNTYIHFDRKIDTYTCISMLIYICIYNARIYIHEYINTCIHAYMHAYRRLPRRVRLEWLKDCLESLGLPALWPDGLEALKLLVYTLWLRGYLEVLYT